MTHTAPWSPFTPPDMIVDVQTMILECLRISGILLQPFIPEKAGKLLDALDVPVEERSLAFAGVEEGSVGVVRPGVRLFDRRTSVP